MAWPLRALAPMNSSWAARPDRAGRTALHRIIQHSPVTDINIRVILPPPRRLRTRITLRASLHQPATYHRIQEACLTITATVRDTRLPLPPPTFPLRTTILPSTRARLMVRRRRNGQERIMVAQVPIRVTWLQAATKHRRPTPRRPPPVSRTRRPSPATTANPFPALPRAP